MRKFQSRCKAAFLDKLAILAIWFCIGKRSKVDANKAWFHANYSPVLSAEDTVYGLRQLV